jgi:hypothetical protein
MKCIASVIGVLVLLVAVFPAQAGRFGGPGKDNKVCQAYGSVTYYETFRGCEIARVAIVGDGDTDLDIYVYDMQGRLVARGIGPSDVELVSWYPAQTQTYRIVIVNLGSVWNRYALATN